MMMVRSLLNRLKKCFSPVEMFYQIFWELQEGDEAVFKVKPMKGGKKNRECAVNISIAKLSSRSYLQIDKYLTFAEAIISRKKKSLMREENRSLVVKRSLSDQSKTYVDEDISTKTYVDEDISTKTYVDEDISAKTYVDEDHVDEDISTREGQPVKRQQQQHRGLSQYRGKVVRYIKKSHSPVFGGFMKSDTKIHVDEDISTKFHVDEDISTKIHVDEDISTKLHVDEDISTKLHVDEDISTKIHVDENISDRGELEEGELREDVGRENTSNCEDSGGRAGGSPKAKKIKIDLSDSSKEDNLMKLLEAPDRVTKLFDPLINTEGSGTPTNASKRNNLSKITIDEDISTADLLSSPSTWRMLIKQISSFSSSFDLLKRFIDFFVKLHNISHVQKESFREALKNVTEENEFFHPMKGAFRRYLDECMKSVDTCGVVKARLESIKSFILIVGQCNSERRSVVLAFVKLLMMKKEGHGEMAPLLFRLLIALTSRSVEDISHLEWKELPLTLKASEISSEDLINAINLRSVKIEGSYDSPDDYIDTYFRLLREDCFYKLKACIKDLLNQKLGDLT